jgi:hypothetical protein
MKRILCRFCVNAALLLALVPAAAQAEQVAYHFRGNTATARFETTAGCISTSTEVFVYEFPLHEPPGPPPQSPGTLFVTIFRQDTCNGTLDVLFGEAAPPAEAFSVQGNLQSASLSTTLQVQDFSTGTLIPVSVDITWTGVGEVSRENRNENTSSPGLRAMRHSRGTSRDATAAGSVLLGTVNLAPEPSAFAYLTSSHVASVMIQRF